jgi:hypothetical protein
MRSLVNSAKIDYNMILDGLKQQQDDGDNITMTVVECGYGGSGSVRTVESLKPVKDVSPLDSYIANGSSTPLWDSVGMAVNKLSEEWNKPSFDDSAYLVMVITDGYENSSRSWFLSTITQKIKELQATDKWTFVFRVPVGHKAALVRIGVPEGNVIEWEQTTKGYTAVTQQTSASINAFFKARKSGQTSTDKFFVDLGNVSHETVVSALTDVSNDVKVYAVDDTDTGIQIRSFFKEKHGDYQLGRGFYQLSKTEVVQDGKNIIILDTTDNKYYTGVQARGLLGLPMYGKIKLVPSKLGKYEVFVQSTSVNRKMVGDTKALYFVA